MSFVAFAVESFGAIGHAARKFLRAIADRTSESNVFYIYALRRVAIAIQKGNARVMQEGKAMMRAMDIRGARSSIIDVMDGVSGPSVAAVRPADVDVALA